jgi:hypothetical protein
LNQFHVGTPQKPTTKSRTRFFRTERDGVNEKAAGGVLKSSTDIDKSTAMGDFGRLIERKPCHPNMSVIIWEK